MIPGTVLSRSSASSVFAQAFKWFKQLLLLKSLFDAFVELLGPLRHLFP